MPKYRLLSKAFIDGVIRNRDEIVEIDSPPEITPHELVKESVAKAPPSPSRKSAMPKDKPVPTVNSTHQHLDVKTNPVTGNPVPVLPIPVEKPKKD